MTTQQSGFIGPGDAESSQVLVKSLVKAAFRGEPLFRSSRPDFIETYFSSKKGVYSKKIVPVFQAGLH